ncbi:MAG: tRNA(His) guanylyltransferase Thg1 family protein [Methanomethylovorans sp.]|uniref:tRNA(His) guanylyltransferase Thg1 family protein n=1 Tax=Methanomethylovorans sp. TaxID=2758717 RepID=UPI000A6D4B8D|nr:tRNA(His) guanylyltransferase Thg1 family protein [Methanomethylovorans sp.]
MKEREIYSDLRCTLPFIIRVDGRAFRNSLLRLNFQKPFDSRFAISMGNAVEMLFKKSGISPVFGYIFSDEINLLFKYAPFDGRVEKLNSVVPSFLSSALTLCLKVQEPLAFDSRIVPLCKDQIMDYLSWRQKEAWRNCINSYAFYVLVSKGYREKEAAITLKKKRSSDIHELLFRYGINIAKVPAWQRKGMLVHKEQYSIVGYNPLMQENTSSIRTRVVQNWDIPQFTSPEGRSFIDALVGNS